MRVDVIRSARLTLCTSYLPYGEDVDWAAAMQYLKGRMSSILEIAEASPLVDQHLSSLSQ